MSKFFYINKAGNCASSLVMAGLAMILATTSVATPVQAADLKILAERIQTGDMRGDVVAKMGGEPTSVSTQRWLGIEAQTLSFANFTEVITVTLVLGRVVSVESKPLISIR